MTNFTYKNDLPDNLELGPIVAIDTETMGLNPMRDRLCFYQLLHNLKHVSGGRRISQAIGAGVSSLLPSNV